MTYQETVEYLFNSAPLFQNLGGTAYKEGLSTTWALDEHTGHPHRKYRTIHVAGTNGKGSCSHTLAAILQKAGYKVGLYTSPHLVDFRERIRINGKMIPEQRVMDFVSAERAFFEPLHPSFFELTTALALQYFAEEQVDVAVIEVGLGGRLDCTNIIHPDLSIITNISFDHTQFLGTTLPQIASEKAGIIKTNIPVVVGETGGNPDVRSVFCEKAQQEGAPLTFADEGGYVLSSQEAHAGETGTPPFGRLYETRTLGILYGELGGFCQEKNTATLLCALEILRTRCSYIISDEHIRDGFANVSKTTGLRGRWQNLDNNPLIFCDTGHNVGGLTYIADQLSLIPRRTLRMVVGMVNDKDLHGVLALLPRDAEYYFTKAEVKRALDENEVARQAREAGLHGRTFPTVEEAFAQAQADADPQDLIFIGGSSFIVADLLRDCFPQE